MNPLSLGSAPKRRDRQHWTETEARRFLVARRHDRLLPVWQLALDTGARRIELVSITWPDLDLDTATVRLRDARDSTRTVVISLSTVSALRAWLRAQVRDKAKAGDRWVDGIPGSTGHVLVNRVGVPYRPEYLTRAFKRAVREVSGVPPIPLHGLRHTSARIALAHGLPVTAVTRRLGHLDASTTLEVYPHVLTDSDTEHGGDHQ
jgi:integrase